MPEILVQNCVFRKNHKTWYKAFLNCNGNVNVSGGMREMVIFLLRVLNILDPPNDDHYDVKRSWRHDKLWDERVLPYYIYLCSFWPSSSIQWICLLKVATICNLRHFICYIFYFEMNFTWIIQITDIGLAVTCGTVVLTYCT